MVATMTTSGTYRGTWNLVGVAGTFAKIRYRLRTRHFFRKKSFSVDHKQKPFADDDESNKVAAVTAHLNHNKCHHRRIYGVHHSVECGPFCCW